MGSWGREALFSLSDLRGLLLQLLLMGCDLQNMRQERLFILGLPVADIPLQLVAGPAETLTVPKQVSNPRIFSIHSARGVVLSTQSTWRGRNRFKFLESQAERKMPMMGLVFIGVVNFLRRAHTATLPHPAMLTNGTSTRSRIGALFAPGSFFFMLTLRHCLHPVPFGSHPEFCTPHLASLGASKKQTIRNLLL
jgi:hypothetical protein